MKNVPIFKLLAAAILVAPAFSALAATRTWDGGGADNNWATAANWNGPDIAPVGGDSVAFGFNTPAKYSPNNDNAANTLFGSITFNTGAASGYTLSGNTINLSSTIANLDNDLHTINLNLELVADVSVFTSGGDITIGGAISGFGGIIKANSATLNLNGISTSDGGVQIQAGTIVAGVANALGSGDLTFAGAGAGILSANSTDQSMGALTLSQNGTLNLEIGGGLGDLTFASGSGTGLLTVNNWSGVAGIAGGGDDDRIFMTVDPGVTFRSQIQFSGGYAPGAYWVGGELVPVPEPTEWALIVFAVLAILYKFVLPKLRRTVAC